MSELATLDAGAAMDRAADPGEFVIECAERGKAWLAEALASNDLDALVNIKGWAETLRVATMQKQLGKDAELTAAELVRRAERCIGLGIRDGQKRGEITTKGRRPNGVVKTISEIAPKEEWRGNNAGIAHLTDGVTDEQFERAIEEAKAEKNLSRANVVRKARGVEKPAQADRHEVHRGTRRINPQRILNESAALLDGIACSLALIEDIKSLDAEQRLAWLDAIREPLSAINRFKKELAR